MGVPTWASGQVLTASDVNTWFVPKAVYKGSTTARTSTTTLADDPDLTFTVAASATYLFQALLIYDGGSGGSVGNFKFAFTVPTSATLYYGFIWQDASSVTHNSVDITNATNTLDTNGLGTWFHINIRGTLVVSSTAGSMTLQWAQGTSNGTRVDLSVGSHLTAQRVA